MTTDPTDLEARLRGTLTRTADAVVDGPRPALSWEQPAATATVTALAGRRPRLRSVVRIAAPVAVAAAVAAAVALPGGPAADAPAPTVQVQETALLAPGGTLPMQPGQYLYSRNTRQNDGMTYVQEYWVPQDATDVWTYRASSYDPTTGELLEEPLVESAPCGHFAHPEETGCTDAGSWDNPTPRFLADLPTDPAALSALLVEWGQERTRLAQGDDHPVAFGSATDEARAEAQEPMDAAAFLAESTVGMSQPFSQALERAVAALPGVVATPGANGAGVPGTSYAAVTPGGEVVATTLVFDADGNYVGGPTTDVVVGAADEAGVAPADR
jgi:hypothetical protein